MKRSRRTFVVLVVVGFAVLAAGPFRLHVTLPARLFLHKAMNRLPDVSWGELITILRLHSDYPIQALADSRNPHAVIRNPHSSTRDVAAGNATFSSNCAACHGANAHGGSAPRLSDGQFKHGNGDWALFRTISHGIPGTEMQAMDLGERKTWEVIAYLRSLNDLNEPTKEAETGNRHHYAPPTTYDRLRNAASEPENWLTYSGAYAGQRYSTLDQIRPENAHRLRVHWVRQFPTDEAVIEATPLVNHDLMYVTEPPHMCTRSKPPPASPCGVINEMFRLR